MKKMTKAHKEARSIARLNKWDADKVFRARDTSFPKRFICYVIQEQKDCAVVIYGDAPRTVVSTGNHAGRFERTEQ